MILCMRLGQAWAPSTSPGTCLTGLPSGDGACKGVGAGTQGPVPVDGSRWNEMGQQAGRGNQRVWHQMQSITQLKDSQNFNL